MSEFKDVTVVKKANVYFEGKVTSRTIVFADGSKKTLGIMLPGEYTFNTDAAERMEILGANFDSTVMSQRNAYGYDRDVNRSVIVTTPAITAALRHAYGMERLVQELEAD